MRKPDTIKPLRDVRRAFVGEVRQTNPAISRQQARWLFAELVKRTDSHVDIARAQ
jgi:hypothetical protein